MYHSAKLGEVVQYHISLPINEIPNFSFYGPLWRAESILIILHHVSSQTLDAIIVLQILHSIMHLALVLPPTHRQPPPLPRLSQLSSQCPLA